ncbi:hypothetical protein O6H91_01G168300 [Diphasiastrum complanatum]|uniref:Uncharacterized protein n=1 Tax=Diphasiastrum complanatum TaxID=34168 RepID=A0ACC2EYZ5_DIPCM|nr:hypothetical protein O6H91_01G168300 [Diphasiastrum complanatum]
MASDKNLNLNLVPKISIHFTILYKYIPQSCTSSCTTPCDLHLYLHCLSTPLLSAFASPLHKRRERNPHHLHLHLQRLSTKEWNTSPLHKRRERNVHHLHLHLQRLSTKERNPHIIQRFQLLWFVFEREGRFTSASFCWAPACTTGTTHRHHRQQVDA